ncbi:iron-containing redox enzyme family protein [Leucobacter viscericola]|uniref:Iron-containing redox enzyme family protein n=1 Tax=Leucobacter viscericola TaxID=2714935 RepID=A0A6G7XJT6_9MICO|nr:iron-containing redox enzyme family protein [Leucobacter viscericola]
MSEAVLHRLTGSAAGSNFCPVRLAQQAIERAESITRDDDIQLALFYLYASSYGSLEQFTAELEWDTDLIESRQVLEAAFEHELRERVSVAALPAPDADQVARSLFALTGEEAGPSMSRYFSKKATLDQAREFLVQRSIYTLREADPHSWAIPRLRGRPKAALVEIQSDEYGGGRPDRVHAEIFAVSMRAAGLDSNYAAYLDRVPAITLASQNMMSMFGLNRRLLGAIVGHLAAFEMTSSIPNRMYGDGFRRLGFGTDVTDYFDEHVEADAVHEQIAGRDMAGTLAEDRPELLADIMFGAACCLAIDGEAATHMLNAWSNGESSLR